MVKRPTSQKSRRLHLVVLDPQNSFYRVVSPERQQIEHDGELCIVGAWEDMCRVGRLIEHLGSRLVGISCTMDSRQRFHISHAVWYKDHHGKRPEPFTHLREDRGRIINYLMDASGQTSDIGEFTTFVPNALPWTLHYLKALAERKRYLHRIWPEHCLIGTSGHNIVAPLMDALLEWSSLTNSTPDFVTKGSNPCVEHLSAVQAEVSFDGDDTMGLKADPSTQLNAEFIQAIMEADEILLAGSGWCLANTAWDIANCFADDAFARQCVLLTDGTTPVPGLEAYHLDFVKDLGRRGMRTATIKDYLA